MHQPWKWKTKIKMSKHDIELAARSIWSGQNTSLKGWVVPGEAVCYRLHEGLFYNFQESCNILLIRLNTSNLTSSYRVSNCRSPTIFYQNYLLSNTDIRAPHSNAPVYLQYKIEDKRTVLCLDNLKTQANVDRKAQVVKVRIN